MTNPLPEETLQSQYFTRVAKDYDARVQGEFEHSFALAVLLGLVEFLDIRSILDVGAGTGRGMAFLRDRLPNARIVGLEPVAALREQAYEKGVPREDLVAGDGTNMAFDTASFDLVCAFGVLHHVRHPDKAVDEMLRVSRRAVFISDSNRYGQGSRLKRTAKSVARALGLSRAMCWATSRGRGFTYSEGDGVAYSYSVFDDYERIATRCRSVHVVNTDSRLGGPDHRFEAAHVALLGVKST